MAAKTIGYWDYDPEALLRCETCGWRGPGSANQEPYDTLRYGERLAELRPTEASEMYLYGDKLSAPDTVAALNAGLKERGSKRA